MVLSGCGSQWFLVFLNDSECFSVVTCVSQRFPVVLNGEHAVVLCSSQFYKVLLLITSDSQWLPWSG